MSLIDYLNELIDYSMGFPFYQRLNPLANFKHNIKTYTQLQTSYKHKYKVAQII